MKISYYANNLGYSSSELKHNWRLCWRSEKKVSRLTSQRLALLPLYSLTWLSEIWFPAAAQSLRRMLQYLVCLSAVAGWSWTSIYRISLGSETSASPPPFPLWPVLTNLCKSVSWSLSVTWYDERQWKMNHASFSISMIDYSNFREPPVSNDAINDGCKISTLLFTQRGTVCSTNSSDYHRDC